MAYTGPSSGVLNVIPIADGAYTPAPPTSDIGGDGDYALDLNTNIFYGPKDSTQTNVWPVGTRLGGQLVWQGTWSSASPPYYYNTGDVVTDDVDQFVCIKPHTVAFKSSGPFNPGDFYSSGSFSAGAVYLCIAATSADPPTQLLSNNLSSYWVQYSLVGDASGTYGATRNWAKLSGSIQVDSSVTVGLPTSFVLGSNAVTTANIVDRKVTNAKLDNTSPTQAVSTGVIRDGAVTTDKLGTGAVTSAKILDGTIATGDIAAGAITQPLLSASAVGETNISPYLTTGTLSPSAYLPATKIVSANTTVSGTSISTTNPVLDAASAMIERSNGMWLYPWSIGGSGAATSGNTRFTRFRANRPLTIKSMAVIISGASTNAETLQFGLYDSAGNRLVSSGNATLYTTAGGSTTTTTTSTGVKYAVLNGSTGYTLSAGSEYYAAFAYTYTSGTGIAFAQGAGPVSANVFQLFGTTVGLYDAAVASVSTLPSTMGSAGASAIQPTFALLTV